MKKLVKANKEEKFFQAEHDNSYVKENTDYADSVYKYYVFNPYGDGDGYVEVSMWDDGYCCIESYEDVYTAPPGALRQMFNKTHFLSKGELESTINRIFKKYVNQYMR